VSEQKRFLSQFSPQGVYHYRCIEDLVDITLELLTNIIKLSFSNFKESALIPDLSNIIEWY
jgi:hypothetical protein